VREGGRRAVGECYSSIAAEKTNFPVAVMCRVLGVSRTGFHNWERRAPSDRALTDAWLTDKIRQIHQASRGVCGAPRIHAELRLEHEVRVGRKRVARPMGAAGIAGVRPSKRFKTTIRIPGITPATDLVERQFRPDRPNVLWVADITDLRTGDGWPYLAAVQDAYSRLIVDWSMATHMRATLVVDALKLALARRRPPPGLMHHSDQGGQYVSLAFGRAARDAGIAISIGSRGDAYDNAVAETFFATLKKELVSAAPGRTGSSCSPPCSHTSRRSIAVGTPVGRRPPRRSQRARLTHWAPDLGSGGESLVGPGVGVVDSRDPPVR
jgi:putative transposase